MSKSKTNLNAKYIPESDWQELYILSKHWKSDILFYRDDLKFLHNLIDKYFIWITRDESLKSIQKVGTSILEDSKVCNLLLEKIEKHLSNLANVIDDSSKNGSSLIQKDHIALEEEITLFIKTVRQNRLQLFTVTEQVLDSDNLSHLMRK